MDTRWKAARGRVGDWLRSPVNQVDLLQTAKAAAATMIAWALAEMVLELHQAFLAPWVALLTVHATVYRTFWRGTQTVLAVGTGILVSLVVVQAFGTTVLSFGLALVVALVLARAPLYRDEGITIATTVLFIITVGYDSSTEQTIDLLPDRLLSTAIGVVVALAVNALVLPPLNDRSAQQQIDAVDRALGALLVGMATQLRRESEDQEEDDWIERTREISDDVERAWSLVRTARESGSWNPRRRRHPGDELENYPQVLMRLEEGVSTTRSIARLVRESDRDAETWDTEFRDRYTDLLAEVGRRIAQPEPDVATLGNDLRTLARDMSTEDLSGKLWPLYGALIANLQMIVDVVDDVATARPVRT
ncbi:aromatic acid exporter family protein [Isoptericola halotolerans]|uniref:Membrane protein YccC n=1 Tax=Isoptericola halotolerans TaxID=300560 RepID=A0ABX2A0S4_9MICO|nr:aromatic acid exporter family protein [Isoptericola halotolerans]NOV96457.1 putative membrane protein YccC [Isoptericola halotolerans]